MFHLLAMALLAGGSPQGEPFVNGPFIIFVGPPESGKSTQAKMAATALKLPILAAEDLIAANPNAFAKSNPAGISGMNPRTDPALNELFGAKLSSGAYRNGVILDGYPATKDQVDYLRTMILGGRMPNPSILRLDIPDDTLRKRLGKKADETFEQLLKDYHRELDMFEVYFPGVRIIGVDANGKPEKVAKRVKKALAEVPPVKSPR